MAKISHIKISKNKPNLNPPKVREIYKRRRQAKFKKAIIWVVIVLIFFIGLSFVSRIKEINIQTINVKGNNVLTKEEITKVVEGQLNGRYFYLFNKRNGFIFPSKKIKEALQNSFERIEAIDVHEDNVKTLTVSVKERAGVYLLCDPHVEGVDDKPCFYVDAAGLVFSQAPFFSGNVYFRFYDGRSGATHEVGKKFMDTAEFVRLTDFIYYLGKLGIKVDGINLKDKDEDEFILASPNDETAPPKILFMKDSDYKKIAGDMTAAIATEPLKSLYKNSFDKLLYLDLRFENKVYYKFAQ